MKRNIIGQIISSAILLAIGIGLAWGIAVSPVLASGGSGGGGGADTIKVSKCEYAVSGAYVELLISAKSSNTSASLGAYLPDGTYLGALRNGGGGRYGGDVFVALYIPSNITIKSSGGGETTAACVPFQP